MSFCLKIPVSNSNSIFSCMLSYIFISPSEQYDAHSKYWKSQTPGYFYCTLQPVYLFLCKLIDGRLSPSNCPMSWKPSCTEFPNPLNAVAKSNVNQLSFPFLPGLGPDRMNQEINPIRPNILHLSFPQLLITVISRRNFTIFTFVKIRFLLRNTTCF